MFDYVLGTAVYFCTPHSVQEDAQYLPTAAFQ
jgi:hypothetical protein